MANPKITKTGFVGDLIGTASCAATVSVQNGTAGNRTVAAIRAALQSFANKNGLWLESPFQVTANMKDLVAKWNSNDLDTEVTAGGFIQFTPLVGYNPSGNGYGSWLFTTYSSVEEQYVVNLRNGNWGRAVKISTESDLAEIKTQITSASANYAPKTHSHTASQITDLDTKLSGSVVIPNTAPTLSFGSTGTVGTIAGKSLKVTMPSDPTKGQFSAVSSSADTAVTWVKNNSESVAQNRIDISTLQATVNRIDGTLTEYKQYSGSFSPLPSTVSLRSKTCYDIIEPTASFSMTLPTTGSDTENYLKTHSIVVRIRFGDTVPSITWPSGVYWANGEAPTLEANTVCEANFMYCAYRWCVAYQTFKEATA